MKVAKIAAIIFLFPLMNSTGYSQEHFEPVEPTNRPFAVLVHLAMNNEEALEVSDEIGLFDHDLCVGALVYDGVWPMIITAWGDSPLGGPGYQAGDTIRYKIWDHSLEVELEAISEITGDHGNGTYENGPYIEVNLFAHSSPRIQVFPVELSFGCFPDESIASTLYLENAGTNVLRIYSVVTNGAYYLRVTPNRDIVLNPLETDSLLVEFIPREPGMFHDTIAILSNDIDSPEFPIPVESDAFDPLSIEKLGIHVVSDFAIGEPYPNPFNSTLAIPFSVPSESEITIGIYNLLGQQVYLNSSSWQPGKQRLVIDASGIDGMISGVYFVNVNTPDGKSEVKKAVYMK
ncbi:T9SS type A sorting domain-containing protein [bacterium]|nr:T9SS type A sorting domain-containing protein [bacterium]